MADHGMVQQMVDEVGRRLVHLLDVSEVTEGEPAQDPAKIGERLRAFANLGSHLRAANGLLWRAALDGKVSDYNREGGMVVAAFTAALVVAKTLRPLAESVTAAGLPEHLAQQFGDAFTEFTLAENQIRAMREQVQAHWPWVDAALLTRRAADCDQGKARPAQEVFDQMRHRVS